MNAAAPNLRVTTRAELAALLGFPLTKINYWLYATPEESRYVAFELRRARDRPPRVIEAPIKPIKELQRRLLAVIAPFYRLHRAVHGYVPGRSIITNARIHQRQGWVLRADLSDFFPSINFGRVRGLF